MTPREDLGLDLNARTPHLPPSGEFDVLRSSEPENKKARTVSGLSPE